MLDQKILIFILLLVLFYFVFGYQENFEQIDDYNKRLSNLDGRPVKDTDTNYQYVSNDCKMIGKETTLCDMQQKYKIINNVKYPDGFEFKGIQCLNKKV